MAAGDAASTLSFGVRSSEAVTGIIQITSAMQTLRQELALMGQGGQTSSIGSSMVRDLRQGGSEAVKEAGEIGKRVRAAFSQSAKVGDTSFSISTMLNPGEAQRVIDEANKLKAKLGQTALEQNQQVKMYQMQGAAEYRIGQIQQRRDTQEHFAAQKEIAARATQEQNQQVKLYQMQGAAEYKITQTQQLRDTQEYFTKQAAIIAAAKEKERALLLNNSYSNANLGSQVKTTTLAQGLVNAGQTDLATSKYGSAAVGNIGQLAAMQRELAASTGRAGEASAQARQKHEALTAILNDQHSAVRGLAGGLGLLWLTWGNPAPIAAGAAISASLRGVYEIGKDVAYQLKFIEALTGTLLTTADIKPAVQDSMFKPAEAANALRNLSQHGLSAKDSLTALTPVLQLATLGETDVATAAVTATAAMNAFGLSATGITRIGDVFAKAANVSVATVSGLGESMKQAGFASANYKISLEDTTATLAVLAKQNIVGSAAGTAFRRMVQDLYTPTKKGAEALAQLHIEAKTGSGALKDYSDIVKQVYDATKNMSDSSKNAFLSDAFDERGRKAMSVTLNQYQDFLKIQKELGDSSGTLAKAMMVLQDSAVGAQDRMVSALQMTYSQAFEKLEPQTVNVMNRLRDVFASPSTLTGITNLASGVTNLAVLMAEYSGVLGVLAGGYVLLKIGQMASANVTLLLAAATDKDTSSTARNTIAKEVNASAHLSNATAAAGEAAAMTASGAASAATSAATGATTAAKTGLALTLGRVVAGFNVLGLTIGVATVAYQLLKPWVTDTSEELKKQQDPVRDLNRYYTDLISKHRQWLEQQNKSPAEKITTRNQAVRNVTDAQANLMSADAELAKSGPKEILGTRNDKYTAALERQTAATKALKSAQDSLYGLHAGERIAEAGQNAQDLDNNKQQVIQSVKGLQDGVFQRGPFKGDKEWGARFDALESKAKLARDLDELKAAKVEIRDANLEYQKTLDDSYKPIGNGKKDSVAGRVESASIRNAKEEFEQAKQIADMRKSFDLSENQKEYKSNGGDLEGLTSANRNVWGVYSDVVAAAADKYLKTVKSVEGSIPKELENLTEVSLRKRISAEETVGKLQEKYADEAARNDAARAAKTVAVNSEGTLAKLKFSAAELQGKNDLGLSKTFMSPEDSAAADARLKVQQLYNVELKKQEQELATLVARKGDLNAAESDAVIAIRTSIQVTTEQRDAIAEVTAEQARLNAKQRQTFGYGAEMAFKEYSQNATNAAAMAKSMFTDAMTKSSDALANFVTTGKGGFKELMLSFLANVAKMQAAAALSGLFQTAASVVMGLGGAAAGSTQVGGAGPGAVPAGATPGSAFGSVGSGFYGLANANGNAFESGNLIKFAKGAAFTNSTVSTPTNFHFGQMGEAGPEAIMPLARTSGGALGVRTVGGSGGDGAISITTNVVVNESGDSKSETQGDKGTAGRQFAELINAKVKEVLVQESRQGGLLWKQKAGYS